MIDVVKFKDRFTVRWQFSSADWISHLQSHSTEELLTIYLTPRSEDPTSSAEFTGVIIFDATSPTATPIGTRSLPFRMRTIGYYPFSSYGSPESAKWKLVGITNRWRVVLFGDQLLQEGAGHSRSKGARQLFGNEPAQVGRRTLFQDLFGKGALVDITQGKEEERHVAGEDNIMASSATSLALAAARIFDSPSHQLPPVESLYDKTLAGFMQPRAVDNKSPVQAPLIEAEAGDVEMEDEPNLLQPEGRAVSDSEIADLTQLFRDIPIPRKYIVSYT